MAFTGISAGGWGILGVAAFLIGFSKTGLPGFAIVAVPLSALVIPARESTGIILPMLIVGDVFAVLLYRRHARWRHLVRLIPWALAGIFIGYRILAVVTDRQLRPLIGILILAMVSVAKWQELRSNEGTEMMLSQHWAFAAIMGLVAGIATMLANAAGPVMTMYLLAMGVSKNEFIGTGAWFFCIVNCLKVPFSSNLGLITHESLLLNVRLVPAIIAGVVLGSIFLRKIPQRMFMRLAQVLAACGAVKLLF